jgi:endogenous inhibitor of DNA gyrase (YacG/DUF329 family)
MSRPVSPRPPCPTCGKPMTYLRSRFCSPQCRLELDYQRFVARWLRGDIPGGRSNGRVSNHVRRWLFERAGSKCEQCGWSRVHMVTGHIPLAVHRWRLGEPPARKLGVALWRLSHVNSELRKIESRARPAAIRKGESVENCGDVAQLGERRLCKSDVTGSSPVISIRRRKRKFRERG